MRFANDKQQDRGEKKNNKAKQEDDALDLLRGLKHLA